MPYPGKIVFFVVTGTGNIMKMATIVFDAKSEFGILDL